MVEEIYEIKNQVLERMRQGIDERGVERMDISEVGKMADIVKDLAEAEKACWEAEYYRGVSEAMEGQSGYPGGMYGYSGGGSSGGSGGGGRSGWQNQYGSGRGGGGGSRGGSRRGYGMMGHTDAMQSLKMAMQGADPQERERMMQEMRSMMGGMT